jgi:mannose-1-phosphate guanylyltransferase
MRAVVLVGGFGTRLRPLTYSRPKQMLPVGHRTMLEVVVAALGRQGVDEAVLSLGYQPDAFVSAFPSGRIGPVRLTYAVEPEPLDTAGAIRFAARAAGIDETFVVVNGDVLSDVDVAGLVAFHRDRGVDATIHLTRVEDPSAFGVVVTDAAGRVERFVEKPPRGEAPSNEINAGVYVLEPSVLDRIEPDVPVSIERVTFPALAADGRLFALASDGYWLDAGKPGAYLAANLDAVAGRGPAAPADPLGPGAVADGATVEGSVIGADALVAPGATVRGSLLLPGAVVEADAVVERSILGALARVGAGAHVQGLVVADGVTIPTGARLRDLV